MQKLFTIFTMTFIFSLTASDMCHDAKAQEPGVAKNRLKVVIGKNGELSLSADGGHTFHKPDVLPAFTEELVQIDVAIVAEWSRALASDPARGSQRWTAFASLNDALDLTKDDTLRTKLISLILGLFEGMTYQEKQKMFDLKVTDDMSPEIKIKFLRLLQRDIDRVEGGEDGDCTSVS